MLQDADIERAVELKVRSYALLSWMGDAIRRGFIEFDAAHDYATDPQSAKAWIERHYADLPTAGRPCREDVADFSNLFATYLAASHVLVREPGKAARFVGGHCITWEDAPHLQPRKPQSGDRRRAERLMRTCLEQLASEHGRALTEEQVQRLLGDSDLREPLALYAYAVTLLRRLRGGGVDGLVPLVLWRQFSRTPTGASKRDFRLSAEAILAAQGVLRERLTAPA